MVAWLMADMNLKNGSHIVLQTGGLHMFVIWWCENIPLFPLFRLLGAGRREARSKSCGCEVWWGWVGKGGKTVRRDSSRELGLGGEIESLALKLWEVELREVMKERRPWLEGKWKWWAGCWSLKRAHLQSRTGVGYDHRSSSFQITGALFYLFPVSERWSMWAWAVSSDSPQEDGRRVLFPRQLVTMCVTERGKMCALSRCPGRGDPISPRPCGYHPSLGSHWPTEALPLASTTLYTFLFFFLCLQWHLWVVFPFFISRNCRQLYRPSFDLFSVLFELPFFLSLYSRRVLHASSFNHTLSCPLLSCIHLQDPSSPKAKLLGHHSI